MDTSMNTNEHHQHQHMHEDSSSAFCTTMNGGGMTMYMDGFHSTISNDSSNLTCINLFFSHWTLDTKPKFYAAMAFVIGLGVLVEAVALWKMAFMSRMCIRDQKQQGRLSCLHALQAFLGYMLMLVTMTFSAELLFCVVFGLATGNTLFFQRRWKLTHRKEKNEDSHESNSLSSGLEGLVGAANPCCEFMGDGLWTSAAAKKGTIGGGEGEIDKELGGMTSSFLVCEEDTSVRSKEEHSCCGSGLNGSGSFK